MDLRTDLRWIAKWNGRVATPAKVVCQDKLPSAEDEWGAIHDLITEFSEAIADHGGCFVIGLESEWLVTTVDSTGPTLTISIDRTTELFERIAVNQNMDR